MGSDERLPVVHEPVGESLESQALVPIQPAAPALPAEPDRYQGIASKAFSAKQQKLLLAPTPPDVVEFKPSARGGPPRIGSVPQVEYRRRLTETFGPGGWALRPGGKPQVIGTRVVFHGLLYAEGRYLAEAWGGSDYHPNNPAMGWDDALEAARSDALKRCCKDLGMFSEMWEPGWADQVLHERPEAQKASVRKFQALVTQLDQEVLRFVHALLKGRFPDGRPVFEAARVETLRANLEKLPQEPDAAHGLLTGARKLMAQWDERTKGLAYPLPVPAALQPPTPPASAAPAAPAVSPANPAPAGVPGTAEQQRDLRRLFALKDLKTGKRLLTAEEIVQTTETLTAAGNTQEAYAGALKTLQGLVDERLRGSWS